VTWYQPRNEISLDGQTISVEALAERGRSIFAGAQGRTVAVISNDQATLLAAVLAGREMNMRVLAGTPERFGPDTAEMAAPEIDSTFADGVWTETRRRSRRAQLDTGGLLLLTSGTTGPPKLVHHTYKTIDTYEGVHVDAYRWICIYEPGTYAWYQVIMLALVVPNQSLVIPATTSIQDGYRALVEQSVTAVPSTPSMWRYLEATVPEAELTALPIQRISLGGERADQPLLDSLTKLYPGAALTHLFASTETGAAIVVADRRAGFPVDWLKQPLHGGRVRLRIEGGTLWVKSAYGHIDATGWIDTGDGVEIVDDRVLFVGRRGQRTVSVGGTSVDCVTLEELMVAQPGITWARAFGRPDRFVGNLVALDVVVDPSFYPEAEIAERTIVALCRDRLPPAYEPRWITFLDRPDLGPNQKSMGTSTKADESV
jgi:acyl-coenzyme A synthetase/AMP-(fatty) acid ligase